MSADPCEDFSAFVCSAWKPNHRLSNYIPSKKADLLNHWLDGLEELLLKSSPNVSAAKHAVSMYQACTSRSGTSVADLQQFMSSLGIPWPDVPEQPVSPLRVLLKLAYNFQLPLWFRIRTLRREVGRGCHQIIHIQASEVVATSLEDHSRLTSSGVYVAYWRQFYGALRRDTAGKPPSKDSIVRTAEVNSFVLETLFAAGNNGTSDGPACLSIGSLDTYTKNLSSSQWKSELLAVLRFAKITDEDKVSVSSLSILTAIGTVFAAYTSREIMEHLGWSVAQIFGPLADSELLAAKYDPGAAPVLTSHTCAAEVEATFLGVGATIHLTRYLDQGSEEDVMAVLGNIAVTADAMVRDAVWLDDDTKATARDKIRSVRTVLWKPSWLLKQVRVLDRIFSGFPGGKTSIFSYKERSALGIAALEESGPEELEELLAIPSSTSVNLLDYDHALNELTVSASAIQEPLFAADGTETMSYAGLGFLFAQQLVRSVDKLGRRVMPDGSFTPEGVELSNDSSTFAGTFNAALDRRTACRNLDYDDLFPDGVALEVTYAALEKVIAAKGESPLIVREFTDQQIFFMALCYFMCTRRGVKSRSLGDCNKAVSNFAPFARAFNCNAGAKMDPEYKCSFF
ncbi:endothelin-converting enzyme 2-like [Amblyomma americanum]